MSLNRLTNLLNKVELDQDVNLNQLRREIEKLNLSHHFQPEDISGLQIKGDIYSIDYFNRALWQELQRLIQGVGNNRNTAAQQNMSHSHKVDGSFILIRHPHQHPQVVTIAHDGHYINPVVQSKCAVIVENRQLFLYAAQLFTFLTTHTAVPIDQPIDILFGMGNELANRLHARFLSSYQHLYLCLDLDLGGLKTANSVFKLLPEQAMTFVQPFDIEQRLAQVVCYQDQVYLQQIGELSLELPACLKPYAQLIRRMGRTIEQESYLIHA